MERHSKTNRFEAYPKTVVTLIVVLVILVADLVFTGVYHLQKYGTIHKFADRRTLREPSPVFHHSLKVNGQQIEEKWGHLSKPLYTNSLGFDMHWNERGHEVVARELYAKMRTAFPKLWLNKESDLVNIAPRIFRFLVEKLDSALKTLGNDHS